MKQEDKELLLIDICARLPYGVKVLYQVGSQIPDIKFFDGKQYEELKHGSILDDWLKCTFKPYLFPLSSMTEEQKIECFKGTDIELDEHNEIWSTFPISNSDIVLTNLNNWLKVINWLNKNHFDYRCLIPMDLAIDASGLNIY